MATVKDLVAWIEEQFPPALAESWDAVGLVCGRPTASVRSVRLTVDVTPEVVADAIADGVDFILAHHPVLLGGVTSVAPDDHKGQMIHDLIENRIALYVAHTSADSSNPGVSDALGALLGITEMSPLEPVSGIELDKVTVFVPTSHVQPVLNALAAAGAGTMGNYERCAYLVDGVGTFLPLAGADPHIGQVGVVEEVAEQRLEMVLARSQRTAIVTALLAAHPYEEPAFDIVELVSADSHVQGTGVGGVGAQGLGRIGELPEPISLRDFAEMASQRLPTTHHGVRVAGDLDRLVRTIAVCGGSGDSLLGTANAARADLFVTADLKHHRVSEHLADDGCAIVDVAHFASEFPWCEQTAAILQRSLVESGDTVTVTVSTLVTDPWAAHLS